MRNKRILTVLLIITLVVSTVPLTSFAAAKEDNSVKTYVFFGSDSRANDDSWKSENGGRITKDRTGTQGTPRSDVIMLLKVNNKKKTIEVTSIYRDTLLDVSGKGNDFQKVNKAYADLGPKMAVKALEKNLDIKISGYVATNFKGVAEVIDSMGGVRINIEKDKVTSSSAKKGMKTVPDVMKMCIRETNRVYGLKTPYVKKTGAQKLSGFQAVAYARVRYTKGTDMRRSVRQRTVLSAMSNKYKKANAATKAKVLTTVLNNIDTDISLTEFPSLFRKTASYKLSMKKGFPYYKTPKVIYSAKEGGAAAVFVPCDLKSNVTRLHKYFYGQKKYKPSKTVTNYSNKIVKKTKATYKKRTKSIDNKY